MPSNSDNGAGWVDWLASRTEQTARSLAEDAERLRADAQRIRTLGEENAHLRALAEKVAAAHATYAYAEPNFGVLLSLKEEARAVLARPAASEGE